MDSSKGVPLAQLTNNINIENKIDTNIIKTLDYTEIENHKNETKAKKEEEEKNNLLVTNNHKFLGDKEAEDKKARVPKNELRHWNDMPKHLQFNPYIYTGYRPLMTASECLKSIFQLHNETVNILSHGTYYKEIYLYIQNLVKHVSRFHAQTCYSTMPFIKCSVRHVGYV